MADQDSEQSRGFKVTDRRRFSESGETRPEQEVRPELPPQPTAPSGAAAAGPPPALQEEFAGHASQTEPVTFSTFVFGLSTQALLLLGEIPDPETRAVARDLPGAKQVIDILGILRDKTRNNLEPGEQSLLDSILYDLRMRYVDLVRPGVA